MKTPFMEREYNRPRLACQSLPHPSRSTGLTTKPSPWGEREGGFNDVGGNRNEIANRWDSPTTDHSNKDRRRRDPDNNIPSRGGSACLKGEDIDNPFHRAS